LANSPSVGSSLCFCGAIPANQGERGGGVSGGIQDEDKTVDIPTLLTVNMFYITVTQLVELQIPVFLFALALGLKS
jgi:hypothetical protein